MPSLAAIANIEFPFKTDQQHVKQCAFDLFAPSFPPIERMMSAFDNTQIKQRNLCKPLSYFRTPHSFTEQNAEYVRISLEYAVIAIQQCLAEAHLQKADITDIIILSTTGLATPSLDALIINEMRLNPTIKRLPVFGLGCAGGVAGFAKASELGIGNPDAVVLLIAVELCSLTFLRNDYSKSNFIGSTLFADGLAACLITGDNHANHTKHMVSFRGAQSRLYYNTLDVMGWEFQDNGFKVLFSQDIPTIIAKHVHQDVTDFLDQHDLSIADIKNYIFHPGGKKVLDAYSEALGLDGDQLNHTKQVMVDNGNMSSATVLYVLARFISEGYTNGPGLLLSMGPGFSTEMVLVHMQNPVS